MPKKEIVQNFFYLFALIVGVATFGGSYFIDTEDTIYSIEHGVDTMQKQRIYNQAKPDTTNYQRVLTEAEAKLVNTMSDFIDQGTYKAFPHYIKGQSYQEFDQEMLSIINLEIEYIRDIDRINKKRERQKSNLQLWGSIAVLILMSMGGFIRKIMRGADPEQGEHPKVDR